MAYGESPSVRFELYRIKLIRPAQISFRADALTASDLLFEAINEKPEKETARGSTWHIGNVQEIVTADAFYFAIGRTTKGTNEKFDEELKDFIEEPLETGPYTHCVVLRDLGVAGIAYKSKLSPDTKGIAGRIQSLLSSTDSVVRNDITVEVEPVPDPEDFISRIRSAYALLTFSATFRGPNPVDADELFQKPLAKIASETNAKEGTIKLNGKDLDREAIASIARSTAATGNKARARIRDNRGERALPVSMESVPASIMVSDTEFNLADVAGEIRNRYNEVRGNERNNDQ